MNRMEDWTTPGTRNEILKEIEAFVRKISMDSQVWFNRSVSVELTADNFGVTIKFSSGGHSRSVHVSTDEMAGDVELAHNYMDRLTMQLSHLFHIVAANKSYSSNDQISTKFEL